MTRQVVLKFDVGDMVYVPHPCFHRCCTSINLKPYRVEEVSRLRDLNWYLVNSEWIEESFLVSQSEYDDVSESLIRREQECLRQNINDLG